MPVSFFRCGAFCLAVGTSVSAAGASLTFTDRDFSPSSWQTLLVYDTGGGATYTAQQIAMGGNPGSYWLEATHEPAAGSQNAYVSNLLNGAVFGVGNGLITSIDFSFDLKVDPQFFSPIGPLTQIVDLLAVQNGTYFGAGNFQTTLPTWSTFGQTDVLAHPGVNSFFRLVGSQNFIDYSGAAGPVRISDQRERRQ